MSGDLPLNSTNKTFIYQCVLCGSCQYLCTKGVDFIDLMIEFRNYLSQGKRIPVYKKILLFIYQIPILKQLLKFSVFLPTALLRKLFLIPKPVKFKSITKSLSSKKSSFYDILLFPGCVLTLFYPHFAEKIIRILTQNGFRAILPENLQCCGFPYLSQGWKDKFVELKGKNEAVFNKIQFKYLLVPCGTGVSAFKNHYQLSPEIQVFELSQFFYQFLNQLKINPVNLGLKKEKVTFHHPCHQLKSLGLSKEAIHFMKQFGDRFVDDKSETCCGFGGMFSYTFPKSSKQILQTKREVIRELDADTVVTSCPGCYMQLREGLYKDVKFFIELF